MRKVFSEAFGIFLEGLTPSTIIAAFMMALLGITFRLLISSSKRNPLSPRTPYEFKWSFLIGDNAVRIYKSIALTIIAIFLSLRFADYFIGKSLGPKWTMLYALFLGSCSDFVITRWRMILEKVGSIFGSKKINDDI